MDAPILGKDPIFWNVGGVPVAALPTPEGGVSIRAFDVPSPDGRRVSLNWAHDEGYECSLEEFEQLKRMCRLGLRIHAATGP